MLRVLFSPTLQTLHLCYTQNTLPPTVNTWIPFAYLPPHLFWKTKYEQQVNDKNSNSLGLIWYGGMIFVAMQTCKLYDSKLWSFSECTGCPLVFHAQLVWVQTSSRGLHAFQHKLSHLAEENTNIHESELAMAIICTTKIPDSQHWEQKEGKTWMAQNILHRTIFLTRLQWLHPPLAEGNNYKCDLNLDPVVFSSQWNMGPSLKLEKKKKKEEEYETF